MKNKRNIKNELRRQQRIEAFQRKLDAMEASPEIPQNDRDIKEHEDNSVNIQIANEVTRILSEKKNKESKPLKKVESESSKNEKRTIKKPKKDPDFFEIRYTMPKERSIPGRIINQMMYESGWYDDVEEYLYDENNFVWDDIEWSKNAEKKRDQRLYKMVQAYEDAEDDIQMKKAFLAVKVTTAAALIAALGFSVNFLYNEVHDLIHNSSYVAPVYEMTTLENANPGEIEHAERVLAKIDYNFEYLSRDELLDTIIRVGSEPSKITESRALGTLKKASEFEDQKLLGEIVQEAYEDEYDTFGPKKKQELNQLIYEMLDEDVKIWIRSPENVAKLQDPNNIYVMGTEDVER